MTHPDNAERIRPDVTQRDIMLMATAALVLLVSTIITGALGKASQCLLLVAAMVCEGALVLALHFTEKRGRTQVWRWARKVAGGTGMACYLLLAFAWGLTFAIGGKFFGWDAAWALAFAAISFWAHRKAALGPDRSPG